MSVSATMSIEAARRMVLVPWQWLLSARLGGLAALTRSVAEVLVLHRALGVMEFEDA